MVAKDGIAWLHKKKPITIEWRFDSQAITFTEGYQGLYDEQPITTQSL
jgi:hypothetical protein